MNKIIIINYIKKLSLEDVINFSKNQGINIKKEEAETIYFYIKNRYNDVLNGNVQELLEEIKEQVSSNTYSKILEYYNNYKNLL